MQFCKEFNAATQAQMKDNLIIPVVITIYADRSFTFVTKTPPTPILIKKAAGLHLEKKKGSGSPRPGKEKVGKITRKQLEEIAQIKFPDTNAATLEACMRSVEGTARSMGIDVVDCTTESDHGQARKEVPGDRREGGPDQALHARGGGPARSRAQGGEVRRVGRRGREP